MIGRGGWTCFLTVILSINGLGCMGDDGRAHYEDGIVRLEASEYEAAVKSLDRAIEVNPEYFEAYERRANAKLYLKDYKGMIADSTRSVEINPEHASAYNTRCLAHYYLEDFQSVVEDATKAVELKPDYAEAWINRGLAHQELGEDDKALADYSNAAEAGQDEWATDARFHRAFLFYDNGDYSAAFADFDHVLQQRVEHDPTGYQLSYCNFYMGTIHFLEGAFTESVTAYESYLEGLDEIDLEAIVYSLIVRSRAGEGGGFDGEALLEGADTESFDFAALEMFGGRMSSGQLIERAESDDEDLRARQRCKAFFYIAEKYLLDGDNTNAANYFKKCQELGLTKRREHRFAGQEMQRLEKLRF
ncbi:MAG: tetratricopeptide repeat protein [bacterium]|nr:tetratricopeptide repeat protein [bacterium]